MKSMVGDAGKDRAPYSLRHRFRIVLALFASLVLYSAIRSPVPGVNEPHILTKARHYWDPNFCRGDFYLESPDVYIVFYHTVGLLTRWMTLEQTAWTGRVIALLVLAVGFDRLVSRIVPSRWSSLWVAWIYLSIAAIGRAFRFFLEDWSARIFDLSGEWIVGGIEAKVFAYGFLFAAMGCWIDARRYRAALLAGLAISFHPVVGVWGLIAAVFASLVERRHRRDDVAPPSRAVRQLRQWIVTAALLLVAASPGLIPALKFASGADPVLQQKAAYIQTFYRLQHHLDPMAIPWIAYGSYLGLAAVWLVGRRRACLNPGERWFTWFVAGSVLVLLAGVLLGLRTGPPAEMPLWQIRARLLRFYPFRLADAMIPLAASMVIVGLARQVAARKADQTSRQIGLFRAIPGAALVCALIACIFLPSLDRNPSRLSTQQLADWKDVCGWIAAKTPVDALFLTPTFNSGFKWYAHRPEFVCYKDCPQDAAGIVQWNNRLRFLSDWRSAHADSRGRISAEAISKLRELSKTYEANGIQYIVSVDGWLGPFPLDAVYENRTCRVYSLEGILKPLSR
ncbi:MAG: DUF6798 domain-containing protein [Planctomycetaceae bacterium]